MKLDGTPLLKLYAGPRTMMLQAEDAVRAQERQLQHLMARARNTRFGRDHGFDRLRSVADYQARVELRTYEQFWEQYWRNPFPTLRDVTWPGLVPFFALSSGTTSGATKNIPCTWEMVASNKRAGLDIAVHHLAQHPEAKLARGITFMLGGSTDLERLAPGVVAGDLSGIAAREAPLWSKPLLYPPREVALIPDWRRKLEVMLETMPRGDISIVSGTPGWVLLVLERLAERHPDVPPAELLPDWQLFIHGGVSYAPYQARIAPFLGREARTREVYPASEGFVAIADRGPGEGLRMVVDNGIFYEFVPVEELGSPRPTRHWVGTVETGVEYALALTTNAGLWSYLIGDTVRLVDRRPPRLLITGRTRFTLSVFGEHLIAEEVEVAVLEAARGGGLSVGEWMAGPVPSAGPGQPNRDRVLVEVAGASPPEGAALSARFDAALSDRNADYAALRRTGLTLGAAEFVPLRPGAFLAWLEREGKLGGQHKVPRIVADPHRFANIARFLESFRIDASPGP